MTVTRFGRVVKAPNTFWDEYVATDTWYLREMVADVPEDEMHAAIACEDFSEGDEEGPEIPSEDEGYEQQPSSEESDDDMSECPSDQSGSDATDGTDEDEA